MNRFASLIARLETVNDAGTKALIVADYLSETPEPDRTLAQKILDRSLKPRPVRIALIRGLADARIDAELFALAEAYVGDVGETIALTWVPNRRANRDPALSEIIEALSTLGRSELPKRIESWLDACDETGRWALIKLITGTLRVERSAADNKEQPSPQSELFQRPAKKDTSGSIPAILLYAERTNPRATTSPLRCTFGVWDGDKLAPIGHCNVEGGDAERLESFIAEHTTARFGPVRQVRHDRDVAFVAELAFTAIAETPRRKAGITLRGARFTKPIDNASPSDAASLTALASRLHSA